MGVATAGTDGYPAVFPRDRGHSRWSTAGAVVGVAAVAAVASYEHAYALVRAHGEMGWTGRLIPLTVDGLIYAVATWSSGCAESLT
ncbi:MAG TPA: DUF2637 domain-containing protein [Trebonia sp.]